MLFLEEPLIIKYGGHEDQLSTKYWGMDRFRIYALEKILSSKVLSPGQFEAALEMFREKIRIYILGAEKREKFEEAEEFRQKLKPFN